MSRAVDTALIGWFHTHHDFISVYELNLWQVLTTEPVTPEATFGTFDAANTIKRDSGVIARNLQASAGGFFEFLAPASHVEASRITGQQFSPKLYIPEAGFDLDLL